MSKRKVEKAYNLRSLAHEAMMKRHDCDSAGQLKRMQSGGFKRPGSRNPKKARSG